MSLFASSLLISCIPHGPRGNLRDVEAFLRSTFSSAVSVNIPRGPLPGSHKGVAYVHFSSAECAFREASRIKKEGGLRWRVKKNTEREEEQGSEKKSSLVLQVQPLRGCSSSLVSPKVERNHLLMSDGPKNPPAFCSSGLNAHLLRWKNVPLPPHCIAYSYQQCVYALREKLEAGERGEGEALSEEYSSCSSQRRVRVLDNSVEDRGDENDYTSSSSPLSPLNVIEISPTSSAVVAVLPFHTEAELLSSEREKTEEVIVVVFRTADERDTALEFCPETYAPCGPPSLEFLLAFPARAQWEEVAIGGLSSDCQTFCMRKADGSSLTVGEEGVEDHFASCAWVGKYTSFEYLNMWEHGFHTSSMKARKRSSSALHDHRMKSSKETVLSHPSLEEAGLTRNTTRHREEENDSHESATCAMESELGLESVCTEEAVGMLSEFLEGKGRVAVKDQYGNIVLLRLPTYISSFV